MTILQMLMNVHNKYEGEIEYVRLIQDELMEVFKYGSWQAKNVCIKAIVCLYDTLDDRARFVRY